MSKIKIQIKNRWTGSIIFEYEKQDNTLKETVKEYIRKELATGKSSANLRYADLSSANLRSADLSSADLSYAKTDEYAIAITRICPEGDIIGYKKCKEGIVKLLIPADAKRNNAFGRKCRAEYAKVLELPEGVKKATSQHNSKFTYNVGEIVKPDNYDEDFTNECSGGIHFFITRLEAERY